MYRNFINEILKEVESSNIRISSNDDVEYAVEVIDRLIDKLEEGCPSPKNPPVLKDKTFS